MQATELLELREDGGEYSARYYELTTPINEDITHIYLLTKEGGSGKTFIRGGVPYDFCTADVYNFVTDPVINEVEECPFPYNSDEAYEFAMEHVLKQIDKYTICEVCGKRDTFAGIEVEDETSWKHAKTICRDCGGEDPRDWTPPEA